MTIEGPRVIAKGLNTAVVSNSSAPTPPATVTGSIVAGNWEKLNETCYVTRTYYDLSGYNRGELTAFFAGVDIQEEFGLHGTLPCNVVDLITTEHVRDTDITNAHFSGGALDLPGFPRSTFDMNQVVYGRTRTWNTNLTGAAAAQLTQYSTTMFGTCNAATSDKIYITRILFTSIDLPADLTVTVPPAHYVTSIVVGAEPNLQFMMRQKRSYELAQQR